MLPNSGSNDLDEVKKLQKYTTSRSQNPFDAKSFQHSRVDRQDAKIKVSNMIDEKQQQSGANNGSSNGGEAGKSTTDRTKTRRSLFSVLFHSSSKHKQQQQQQQQQEQQQDDADQANNNSLDISSDSEIAEFLKKGDDQVNKCEPGEGDSYELELDDRLAIEKSWQGGLTIKNRRSPSPKGNIQDIPSPQTQDLSIKTSTNTPSAATRLPKSPLLEQFLNSHKIQLNSMDSSSESAEIDDDDDSSGESLHNQTSGVSKKSLVVGNSNDASARDLRLVNWRLMAAKSMWSANSLPSSDSDFDPLDCDSPALVVTCSDDTSCSSVELIWTPRASRPPASSYGFAALELRPSAAQQRNQKHQNINHSHLLLRPTSGSSGVSLISAQSDQSVSQLELVKKAEPQKVPDVSVNSRPSKEMQRFSIFELAKPNRAKGKQIGRRRSECRRSKDSNSVQWVANPLFSNDENDEDNELDVKQPPIKEAASSLKRCASHESVVVIKPTTPKTDLVEQKIEVKVEQEDLNKKAAAEENIAKDGKLVREQSDRIVEADTDSSDSSGKDSDNDANDELDCCETESEETAYKKAAISTKPSITKRDNNYLAHIMNLDKRIKSNVSSLKSQISVKLSDTGKRASVLADQLIASIKDTTKETQELFGTTSSRSRRDKSFKSSSKDSTVEPMSDNKKAKLYSLIYMHQQHASGQPVITRQPLPSSGLGKQHTSTAQPPPVPPRPNIGPEVQVADVSISSDSFKSETRLQVDKPIYSSREQSNNNIQNVSAATKTKLRRRKRARCKPSSAPPPSSDEEEDFYQVEYNKLRNKSQLSKKRRQKRSLNYWRRFRMRQLGLEWKLVREDNHRSLDLTDLLGTANYYDINEDFLYSYRFERTY